MRLLDKFIRKNMLYKKLGVEFFSNSKIVKEFDLSVFNLILKIKLYYNILYYNIKN